MPRPMKKMGRKKLTNDNDLNFSAKMPRPVQKRGRKKLKNDNDGRETKEIPTQDILSIYDNQLAKSNIVHKDDKSKFVKDYTRNPCLENIKNNIPETHSQEQGKVQPRWNEFIAESCPVCKEKNILSSIEKFQLEQGKHWVSCTRTGCCYLEEFVGRAVVTTEYLKLYGLPGDLLQHVDIYREDVNKIIRLCMAECIKTTFLSSVYDLEEHKQMTSVLAESHGLKGSLNEEASRCQATSNQGLVSFAQPSKSDSPIARQLDETCQSTKSKHKADTSDHDLTTEADARTNLPFQFESSVDEFLSEFLQSFNTSEKEEDKDMHETMTEESSQTGLRQQNYNVYDSVKELADALVEDLPISYQEEIKLAFSKIKGYKFPQDFAKSTPEKIPLFKILKEEKKKEQMRMKVEAAMADDNITESVLDDFFLL